MKCIKGTTIFILSFIMIFLNGMNVQNVHAANQIFALPESTNQTQTHTITMPHLKSINSITSNSGTAIVHSINGDDATVRVSGGSYSRRVQIGGTASASMYVTNQTTSYYNSGGYSGTLTQYVYSGTYTPEHMGINYLHMIDYSECKSIYSGYTLYSSVAVGDGMYRCVYEVPTLIPASDTRVYRYQGNVTKPDTRTYQNYYQYTITVDYIDNTAPVLAVTNTSQTVSANNGYNTITLQGCVRDVDNNPVTISATINGKNKSTVVSGTSTTKNWSLTWNVSSDNITEGVYSNVVVQANDGQGGTASDSYTGFILVDRTKPTITFTPEAIEPTFKDLEVQLATADAGGSGFKEFRYAWTKNETRPTDGWSEWDVSTNPIITQDKGGKWYLHIEATDVAGNVGYAVSGLYEKIVVSGGASVNINVFPTPTGVWLNQAIDVYVMDSGDSELLAKAKKTYEVTNSPLYPITLSKTIPADKKIQLNLQGENFVHVQYILEDGTKISATAGPYFIDTGAVGDFDMKLVNATGVEVTDWTKETVTLVIGNPTTSTASGFKKQYRIEGLHTDWQTYEAGTKIELEGQHRIFGRIINGTGSSSAQKVIVSKIDRTNPNVLSLKLLKSVDGTYDVSAKAEDQLTGIQSVRLNTGLTLTANNNLFTAKGLTAKPTNVTIQDQAGNTLTNVPFAAEPSIAFNAPYTTNLEVFREDVIANLSGATGYLIGNKGYACSTDPCQLTLSHNTTLTAVRTEDVKETRAMVKIENIDKTTAQLLLNGKRNATTPLRIEFDWNYPLSASTMTCAEDGKNVTYTVSGTSFTLNGKNYTYHCTLAGAYKGETLTSNTVVIYADGKIPVEGTNSIPMSEVTTNIYLMETKVGKGYIINAKSDNYKFNELPLPMNEITKY